MYDFDQRSSDWFEKVASDESSLIGRQIAAHKAMRSDATPMLAKPELIKERVYQSFKLGTLAGLIAAAVGGAAGAAVGAPEIGAAIAGHYGLLGGSIKGQANANADFLKGKGFDPKGINILRFLNNSPGAALTATNLLPESGHISV